MRFSHEVTSRMSHTGREPVVREPVVREPVVREPVVSEQVGRKVPQGRQAYLFACCPFKAENDRRMLFEGRWAWFFALRQANRGKRPAANVAGACFRLNRQPDIFGGV